MGSAIALVWLKLSGINHCKQSLSMDLMSLNQWSYTDSVLQRYRSRIPRCRRPLIKGVIHNLDVATPLL